jgi:probable HAF family extracellular repeat protein
MGLVAIATAEVAQAQVTFSGLGDLPGGSFESAANAVSADGRVIVGSSISAFGLEAFRWEDGVMTGLGDLPGGDFESTAYGISLDGWVIVGRSSGASGGEAFRWEDGVMNGLGDLPGGDFSSTARGASADGSVIVGISHVVGGWEAFRWEGGSMEGLGDLPGGLFRSGAQSVSGDGEVAVGVGNTGDVLDLHGALWEDDAIVGLGFLADRGPNAPGAWQSLAFAVSADGSVIVGTSDNWRCVFDPYAGKYVDANYDEPFRWQDGVMTSLFDGLSPGDPPGQGWTFGQALAVNADGSVIVGWGYGPFIWDEWNGMRDLGHVLEDDLGLDLTGWRLRRATGVSEDGTVIVGYGWNPQGDQEAWMAVIPVPEPSRWLMLGVGIAAVLGLSRMRRR